MAAYLYFFRSVASRRAGRYVAVLYWEFGTPQVVHLLGLDVQLVPLMQARLAGANATQACEKRVGGRSFSQQAAQRARR